MSKEFLRFVGKSIIFLGIFFGIVIMIDVRLEKNMPTHAGLQYAALLHPTVRGDVLILGSSTAVHGYDPSQLSDLHTEGCDFSSIYNFGMVGAQPPFYVVWYREFIGTYYPTPSLVIISLDWFSSGPREERQEKLGQYRFAQDSRYLPWNVLFDVLKHSDSPTRSILILNLFRLLRADFDIFHMFYPKHDPTIERFNRGFIPLDHVLESRILFERLFHVDQTFLQSLRELIYEIKQQGTDVLLVQIPTLDPENIEHMEESRIFAVIANEEHVPYLNYNDQHASAINQNMQYFSDWSHLNRQGVAAYSLQLKHDINRLIQNKSVPLCEKRKR